MISNLMYKILIYFYITHDSHLQRQLTFYRVTIPEAECIQGVQLKSGPYFNMKHLESFEMWCWRRMEQISWTDHVREEEVLLRVKEQRNILQEIRKGRRTGLVTFYLETAFYSGLLKERYKGG